MTTTRTSVAFCENGAGYGGAIISLAAMLEHLDRNFEPFLYTNLGTEPYRQLARLGRWRQMRPSTLVRQTTLQRFGGPFASMMDNLCNVMPYALRYYRAFRRDRVRIVYLNNDANCNVAAALGARLAGLPIVLHARGFHADTRATRWVLGQLDHCIAVSHAVRKELLGLGLAPEKCTVVAEGLDLAQFHPQVAAPTLRQELGLGENDPVVTLVGGLIDWKGQDVLLDAAPAILAARPDAWILIVGSAYGKDNRFAEDITRRVADPALRGRVRLLGARKDIPQILSISSVVLHASTKPEPFGRTFLEGMALGKPTIASNEGGPLDVIEHEVDGLLIAPRKPEVLAAAIVRLLSDPAFSADLGRKAARRALDFSIERHTEAVGAVLSNTLQAHYPG